MGDERDRERVRMNLEDAVCAMLDEGYTAEEVKAEVEYALETAADG